MTTTATTKPAAKAQARAATKPKPTAAKARTAPKLTEAEQLAADEAALAERRRKIAAEATVIDEDGEAVEVVEAGAEIAVVDEWEYQTIEYANETWQVRKPSPQALAGFMLATGKYVPNTVQQNMVGLFLVNHLSADSYERIYVRLLDPEDPDFTPDSLGEIMSMVATMPDEDEPAEDTEADA